MYLQRITSKQLLITKRYKTCTIIYMIVPLPSEHNVGGGIVTFNLIKAELTFHTIQHKVNNVNTLQCLITKYQQNIYLIMYLQRIISKQLLITKRYKTYTIIYMIVKCYSRPGVCVSQYDVPCPMSMSVEMSLLN